MLLPQFSIRLLLLITTACAVVFSVFGLAVRGHGWAVGVSIGVLSLAVAFAMHALLFAGVWAFSLLRSRRGLGTGGGDGSSHGRGSEAAALPRSAADPPGAPGGPD